MGHEHNPTSDVATLSNDVAVISGKVDGLVTGQSSASAAITVMADAIGTSFDTESTNSIFGKSDALFDHAHSHQKVIPTLANGVTVTGGVAAWALGAFAIIVPTNVITKPFDIHHVHVAAYNANDTFELVLYAGADASEVEVGRIRFTRTTNVGATPHLPMMTSVIPANTQIKAKIASQLGTSNTAVISLMYHEYA